MTLGTWLTRAMGGLVWLSAMATAVPLPAAEAAPGAAGSEADAALTAHLDAPVLFVKRLNYEGIHIYDTYYKWRPGGGIYVLGNPAAPPAEHRVRPVIDATTPNSLGPGIYSEPELSYDATRLLFCYKGEAGGSTSIYEIGVDGTGLRRVTDPTSACAKYKGSLGGQHDVGPAYLPDGRIVFKSTRPSGLVPCFNTGVDIMHVMNADGSDIHPISVNNVNEFDPCVLPDGRILHGRWEYIDKTALTQQSLWTIFPDGTNETALFANNMVHPEAVLDARPVPGSPHLVVGTFAPHNSTPRGSIAFIDPLIGKNDPKAIFNLEHPDNPTHDRGESCEPCPLSADVVLYSGRPAGAKFNALLLIDRRGRRAVVHAEPDIDCHSPMLVKPQPVPRVLPSDVDRRQRTGRFLVQDVYQGLDGVARGEVKCLRLIEETSRVSPTPGGAFNQTFLMSGVLAWSAKNFLGVVPVEPDGSAYFEAPSGRALYWQALDAQGRLVRSMRTFVQAAPGVTRACIGCHEHKFGSPAPTVAVRALRREPSRPAPESWGSGFLDYPGMVQPVFDKHCVGCHGGEKGFGRGIDLSGGWTEYFNISYENLVSRRETQVTAHLIAGIDCMNGTALWSAQIFGPRGHGSGAAPLAEVLVSGHKDRFPKLTRAERDLVLAWIDSNGLYHGTWDYSSNGCSLKAWPAVQQRLVGEMRAAGCTRCHESGGKTLFENDWFNLERPEFSRILRAPLAEGKDGWGVALCRDRKLDPREQRVAFLVGGAYQHGVMPVEAFKTPKAPAPAEGAKPVVTFASTADPHYQAMLEIIRDGHRRALAVPRVDMPGATVIAGAFRQLVPPMLPDPLPALEASVDAQSVVHLSWERSARTVGLSAEVHHGAQADFSPGQETLLTTTTLFSHTDAAAPEGPQHYAVVLVSSDERSAPIRTTVSVPPPPAPLPPSGLEAAAAPGRVDLRWRETDGAEGRYHVYRAKAGADDFKRLTAEPVPDLRYSDLAAPQGAEHAYTVRAVSRRGIESPATASVTAAAMPEVKEPVFVAAMAETADASLLGGGTARGTVHGKARVADGALDLGQGGFVTFDHRPDFDLTQRLSVECWVNLTRESPMPVIVSCGHWNQAGWFLQRIGGGWRWHVGGIDCDGGQPAPGRWTHFVGTYDGETVRLFQDGRQVAEKTGAAILAPWKGPLHVGQYSGGPDEPYQVFGRMSGLKVYGRAMPAPDAAAAFQARPAAAKP